jgi:uncharacterized membrane protein YuzA (DUF378 family)
MSSTKKWLDIVSFSLVIIGAINLGIFGVVPADANGEGFSLIQQVFGFNPDVQNIFYILIGLSGVYLLGERVKDNSGREARKATKTA